MAKFNITGRFATAQDTAEILGVSKTRTKELIKIADGILADESQRRKSPRKAASSNRRTHAAKSSRSTAKRAARAAK
jgi:hypothetical protein